MFLSFLSCSLFSYAANPRAVIVKCDGCAYDVDVDGINFKIWGSETAERLVLIDILKDSLDIQGIVN